MDLKETWMKWHVSTDINHQKINPYHLQRAQFPNFMIRALYMLWVKRRPYFLIAMHREVSHKIYTQREPLKVCKLRNCKFKLSRIPGWNTECDKTVNCVTDVRQSHQPWQVAGWRVVKNADHLVKAMIFSVVMYGCESWTIKKAEG